jgi:PAS domain S-box-containing protein
MRVLIASERSRDAAQAEALICGCGLESLELTSRSREQGEIRVPRGEGFDVVVIAGQLTGEGLAGLMDEPGAAEVAPLMVLLAEDLTGELATVAARVAARVCLWRHGPRPVRVALEAAARELRERRAREDARHRELNDVIRASESVRALVNVSVNDVVFSLRVEGGAFRFQEVNLAFTKATGLSVEQVVGKLVEEVIPEPSRSLVLWKYREAVSQRRTVRWDEVTEYPAGKRYGEVSVTPVFDAAGRCTTLVGTVHDVTEERERAQTIQRYADIVDAIQIGLTVWSVADPAADPLLEAANPAAERILGSAAASALRRPLKELFPPPGAAPLSKLVTEVSRSRQDREMAELRLSQTEDRIFAVKAFPLAASSIGLALEEVTEQARARAVKASEQRILEMVASGASLEQTMERLALEVEAQAPPAIASILLMSADGKKVRDCAGPHLPAAYRKAIDGALIGPNEGSCGSAAALKRPVIASDVELDIHWEKFRGLAREFGLRACWSTPILSTDGQVLGTFALYYKESRTPLKAELELIKRATHVASIAIQRSHLDEQLRQLSARLEAAREEERTVLARELHDQVGQSLTAMKLDLAWMSRHLPGGSGDVVAKVKELMDGADALIQTTRRISTELRPPVLDDGGLLAALRWHAHEFERKTQIPCVVSSELRDGEVSQALATPLFRVSQEALTNVVRHSGATRVEVRLEEHEGALQLTIQDDGRGITLEQAQDPRSLGLIGIRERARSMGGTAAFGNADPHGTRVALKIPKDFAP